MGESYAIGAHRKFEGSFLVVELREQAIVLAAFIDRLCGFRRRLHCRAPDFLRIEIVAQAQEHGRTQRAILGPTLKFGFDHEPWLNPCDRAVDFGLFDKWTSPHLERFE